MDASRLRLIKNAVPPSECRRQNTSHDKRNWWWIIGCYWREMQRKIIGHTMAKFIAATSHDIADKAYFRLSR